MADLKAKINLKLIDGITAPAKQMQAAFGRLRGSASKPIKDSTQSAIKKQRSFRQELKLTTEAIKRQHKTMNMGTSLKMAAAGTAITIGAAKAKQAIGGALGSIRGEQAALGDLATVGITQFDAMKAKGRELKQSLGVSSEEFIAAAYDIKSGISSLSDEGVAAMTEAAAITAKATKGSTTQMTSFFASAYGMFKEQHADMSDADFGNMFAGSLAKSVQQFKTTGSAMQQAMENAGETGLKMQEQMSIVGMLQASMQAGEAGTALKSFTTNALTAQERLQKAGKKVDFINADDQLKSAADMMGELKKLYGETLEATEIDELKKAFGSDEAMKMIKALWGQEEAIRANEQALKDANGEHIKMAKLNQAADKFNNIDRMKDSATVLKQTMGDALLPAVSALAAAITPLIQNFTKFLENNQALAAVLGGVAVGFTGIASVAGPLLIAIPAISHGMLGLKIALAAIKVASLAASKGFITMGAALMTTPVGWVIAAIAAIAGVAYLIYKNWDKIKPYFQALWNGIKNIFAKTIGFIKKYLSWTPVGMIISNWAGIKNAICNPVETAKVALNAVWNGIKILFNWVPKITWAGIKNAICNPVETAKAALNAVWNGIKTLFNWIPEINWDSIKSLMLAPVEAAKQAISKALDNIKNLFRKAPSLDAWQQQHDTAQTSINGHLSAIEQLTGSRIDALNAIENMTDAEKEQAKQRAESAKLEAGLAKTSTIKSVEEQMRNKRNWGAGLEMLEDIENGGSAKELQNTLMAMSSVGENGSVKLNLKGTGLNDAEYQNLVKQVNELVRLEEQANQAQNALNRIDGRMDEDFAPPSQRPNPTLELEIQERPKELEVPQEQSQEVQTSPPQAISPVSKAQVQSLKDIKKLAREVEIAVKDAEGFLATIDWSNHGIRIMQTLAQGIRTGGVAVRSAVQDSMAGLPNTNSAGGKGLYDGE